MTLAYFLESVGLDVKDIALRQSESSLYKDENGNPTSTKIAWLSFPAPQDKLDGQDYLVLSRRLCEDVLAKKLPLKEASVAESDEGWGLIRPQSGTVLDLTTLW